MNVVDLRVDKTELTYPSTARDLVLSPDIHPSPFLKKKLFCDKHISICLDLSVLADIGEEVFNVLEN